MKPQPKTDAPLRQPDMYERMQGSSQELLELARKLLNTAYGFEAVRETRDRRATEDVMAQLQKYRTQFNNMIASMQRVIDGGV